MSGARLVVLFNLLPDAAESDLMEWFRTTHKPDVESSRRFRTATLNRRFQAPTLPMVKVAEYDYVATYELDAADNDDFQDATDGLVEKLLAGETDIAADIVDWDDTVSYYTLPIDVSER